ncbi:MAG: molecular chaperone TorD family protein [Desulfitobacterium sp.]|nr:molecular chaperone TorD family protein [Desulfitobacterium sp.]
MLGKAEIAWERAKIYELLSGVFLKEPSPEIFSLLKKWGTTLDNPQIIRTMEKIQENDPELEELTQEYYDLFFVPVSGIFVPPFEAAIRGAQREKGRKTKFGSYWRQTTVALSHLYEQIGFVTQDLQMFEPLKAMRIPDHIGLELSAMAYLCRVEARRYQEGQNSEPIQYLERILLEEHLNQWLDLFVEDLKEVDRTGFYTAFASLAAEFCRLEGAELSDTKLLLNSLLT